MKKLVLTFALLLFATTSFSLPSLFDRQLFKVYDIKNIDTDLTWENIDIQECDEIDNILVEIYCNNKKWAPQIKNSGSTVIVKSKKKSYSAFEPKKCTVIFKIPASAEFDSISLSATSGDIHSQIEMNAEKFTSSTTSGNQSFTVEIFAQNVSLTATSGNVFAQALICDSLHASSTSGSIFVKTFDGQTCSFNSTSGSQKLTNAKVNKTVNKATSGSITVEGQVLQAFDIGTTSGTIGMELDDAPLSKSRVSSTSGTIFLGLPGNANFSLSVSTTSGSFTNAITREKHGSHVDYSGDINNGGAQITLSSTSGNISIDSNNGVTGKKAIKNTDTDIPVVSFDEPIF